MVYKSISRFLAQILGENNIGYIGQTQNIPLTTGGPIDLYLKC